LAIKGASTKASNYERDIVLAHTESFPFMASNSCVLIHDAHSVLRAVLWRFRCQVKETRLDLGSLEWIACLHSLRERDWEMKRSKYDVYNLNLTSSLALAGAASVLADTVADRLSESAAVLREIMDAPHKGIPGDLLSKCAV
jgi:hypothetical protein